MELTYTGYEAPEAPPEPEGPLFIYGKEVKAPRITLTLTLTLKAAHMDMLLTVTVTLTLSRPPTWTCS